MKRFLFALFCILNMNLVYAATEMTDVYLLAKMKNGTELKAIKNIDIVDESGDTALCSAIKDGNVDAYNLLKNAGANIKHKCINKIPTEQYSNFITKVASVNNSWSFLGLGKWAWTAIGVGAAGGAVAAGMGGGGSGGGGSGGGSGGEGSGSGNNSGTGNQTVNQDSPCSGYNYTNASQCPAGYTLGSSCTSGTVVKYKCDQITVCSYDTTECTNGYVETGNICVSGGTVYKQCKPAACSGYDYTNSSQCPNGYTTGSSCLSGTVTKYKCDMIAQCPEYNYTDSTQCPNGWLVGSSCKSGTTTKYKCDAPVSCSYQTTSCTTGFHETGNTCKSGDNTYVECEPDACDGFNYTTCPQGWDHGESCQSGNITKYKCDVQHQCQIYNTGTFFVNSCPSGWIVDDTSGEPSPNCYSGSTHYVRCRRSDCSKGDNAVFLSCDEGWHQISNFSQYSCTQYGVTYNVRCEPNDCSGYTKTSSAGCPVGWKIGSSCKSGDEPIKYKCDQPASCPYQTTSCTGGYIETGNTCKSGNTTYKECEPIQCGVHAIWSESGCVCDSGYAGWTAGYGCQEKIDCGAHATQKGTECSCDSGYENWTEGSGCALKQLDCGPNAHQEGTQCLCDYGYENWVSSYKGCGLIKLSCGAHAHQEGTQCLCDSGYKNLTNKGCSLDAINCGAHAYQKGTQCECDSGYENWTEGSGCTLKQLNCGVRAYRNGDACYCKSGYADWTEGYGCYPKRSCGDHAHQKGNSCECDIGFYNWVSGVGCSVYGTSISSSATGKKTINSTDSNSVTGTTLYANRYSLGGSSYKIEDYTAHNAGLYINKTNSSSTAADVTGVLGCSIPGVYNYTKGVNATAGGLGIISITKTGKGNIYGLIGTTNVNLVAGDAANGYIVINNSGTGDIFGIKSDTSAENVAFYYGSPNPIGTTLTNNFTESYGLIDIKNTDNENTVYGLYGTQVLNIESADEKTGALIRIQNEGSGNVYGGYSYSASSYERNGNVYVYSSEGLSDVNGTIAIDNFGNGNVTGLYNSIYNTYVSEEYGSLSDISGDIIINNSGSGNSYGIYNNISSDTISNAVGGTATITINNKGTGNAYGIYAYGKLYNANTYSKTYSYNSVNYYNDDSLGTINIINYSSGKGFGLYGRNQVFNEQGIFGGKISHSEINMQNLGDGTVIGIYGIYTPSTFVNYTINNSGYININNVGSGTAIGIFGDTNSKIINSGVINIVRDTYVDMDGVSHTPSGTAGDVFGVYAKSGSTVENAGTINIKSDGTMYGIYVEGNSTVTNNGIITLNNVTCDNSTCDGKNDYGNYIVLNGSTLYNTGAVRANTLSLNSMKGKVVARSGSSFVVDNDISGDLYISNDIVTSGNQTTYIAENMVDAGDTTGLNLISDSAMFDACLVGKDVVMQMKDFDSLTDNKSLAAFLKHNYDMGNGSDLFATLKSIANMSTFNSALMGLSGLDSFAQFAHEDLSAMREISLSMNNKLFENSDRDTFDISDSMGYFSFSNNHNSGSGQYGISSSKMSDNWKIGYGMAMANIFTNNGDGFSRQNQMWMFYMPVTYTNDDVELVITSQAGFTHGKYNRRGFNNQNYEGYIEKQIVGLMNDLRYPLRLGNWTFAPDMAFNAIMYNQSGQEEEYEFSLIMPNERMISVEAGLGLYSKYEKTFQNGDCLKFTSGIMGYREYGDTYNIKLGIRGMDGTFELYNNDYKYRGAINVGLDYTTGRFHVYGNTQYFMDNANYMNFKGGVSYRF